MDLSIAVIGLGYVGLPLALGLARKFDRVVGFDLKSEKIEQYKKGIDATNEGREEELLKTSLVFTSQVSALKGCKFFIVGVPTPVDHNKRPDLAPIARACELVGPVLSPGSIICFESTVYPGVTEDFCAPLLEKFSGLKRGKDFKLAYSPERINPGDKEHSIERVVKVVSAQDRETLDVVTRVYGAVVEAGVFEAASIKVAEAAKVIENTQRDLNIALMNELAIIFDRIGICTHDVLAAASTKWNFLRFTPGLVGGHCIGVDPYYLTAKAEQLGYHPQVILAGRRINDSMGAFVGQRLIKLMLSAGIELGSAKVALLGVTFKENVSDIRNSRVPDIVAELREFGIDAKVHDPLGDPGETLHEYGFRLAAWEELEALDAVILAVPHRAYLQQGLQKILALLKPGGVFLDLKGAFKDAEIPEQFAYWSL